MRSTRATAAVERLKSRSGNPDYALMRTAAGLFCLMLGPAADPASRLSELLPLDEFVAFVNSFGPQIPRRVTKNDAAFEKQLVAKKPVE
ncbi:hypothetical protein [Actimicrobium antarcticum]|uniref:Uncharacterized protein n=1 Tax=Actimicrobium antarcticum TaxID=1051899 RepID=A0ABP7TJY8_9BURK